MKSAIAILTYNRVDTLKTMLAGIGEHCASYPVAIFDDHSCEDGTEAFLSSGKDVGYNSALMAEEYITKEGYKAFIGVHNLGVARNTNRAIKWFLNSDADHLLLCNDDLLVLGDFPNVYARAHADLEVGMFGFNDFTMPSHRWIEVKKRGYTVKICPRMTGIMTSITRRCLDRVGYYDATFKVPGEEHSCPGDSLVLMGDYGYKKIEEIAVGDTVVGWSKRSSPSKRYGAEALVAEKNTNSKRLRETLAKSVVLHVKSYESDIVEVTMASGTKFKCTPDHLWDNGSKRGSSYYKNGVLFKTYVEPYTNPVVGASLSRVCYPIVRPITDDYKRGYIRGALDGDGTYSGTTILRVDNDDFAGKFVNFATDIFGAQYVRHVKKVKVTGKTCSNHITLLTKARPSTDKKSEVIQSWSDESDDFKRGWLGGIYDAEGSWHTIGQDRNVNPDVCERIIRYLDHFGFSNRSDKHQVIIRGGRTELMRFWNLASPACSYKLDNRVLKSDFREVDKIVAVNPCGKSRVYCMTTSTGNYIIHGYASKNCEHNNRARMTGFVNLDKVPQPQLDIVHTTLKHQEVETSIGKNKAANDREASRVIQKVSKTYRYKDVYRPFSLFRPDYVGASPDSGIPFEAVEDLVHVVDTHPSSVVMP